MANFLISPKDIYSADDANGNPLVGGQLFTYIAGSATPTATYTDATGTVENDNPIILDARGEARVWLNDEFVYKYVLHKSVADGGAEIRTTDNIQANNGGGGGGIGFVSHDDSTTVSLTGLGTPPSPLIAELTPATVTDIANKLDKVQAGAQSVVSEVELKQGLDITGVNPDGSAIRVPNSSWIMPQTAQEALYLTNGINPDSGPNSVLQLENNSTVLTAGNGTTSEGRIEILPSWLHLAKYVSGVQKDYLTLKNEEIQLRSATGRGFFINTTEAHMTNNTSDVTLNADGIRFNGLDGGYAFVNVPDGTPTKFYGQDGSGEMVKGDPVSPNEEVFINQISTGVNYGLSIGSTVLLGTEVTIDLGQGFVLDREDPDALTPKLYKPTFASSFTYEIVDTVSPSMFLYMDKTGAIQEFSSQDDERKHDGLISLGALGVFGGVIVQVVPLPNLSFSPMTHMLDLSAGIGLIRTGAMISTVMNTLNLAQGVGSLTLLGANFYNNPKNPNRIPLSATSPLFWVPATPTELQNAPVNTVNVDQYLVSGVLTTIPNNAKWSILTMFIGANGFPFLFQGQEVTYGTMNEALDALALGTYAFTNHLLFANKPNNAIHAGDLIVEKGMTNLNNAFWKEDNRFGLAGGGGVGSAGAFLDKATIDPQNVAGAVTWAGIQTFDSAINGTSLDMSGGGTFGGQDALLLKGTTDTGIKLTVNNSLKSHIQATGATLRFNNESGINYEFRIAGSIRESINSAISLIRNELQVEQQILQGSVTDTGEGIICESLKSEGDTETNGIIYAKSTTSEQIRVGQGINLDNFISFYKDQNFQGFIQATSDALKVQANTGNNLRLIGDSILAESDLIADSFAVTDLNTAPSSASDTGTKGEIRYTADYMYVCTATNTWKRTALTTW